MQRLTLTVFALLGLVVGCAGPDDPMAQPTPDAPARIELTSPTDALVPGQTVQLRATAYAADGAELPDVTLAWDTSDTAVATISTTGLVTAIAPGFVEVGARAGALTEGLVLTVGAAPGVVDRVEIGPAGEVWLAPGTTTQLTATAYDAYGAEVAGRPVTWTTTDATIATVSAQGLVTGLTRGPARIGATIEGRTAEVQVRVRISAARLEVTPDALIMEAGTQRPLTATVYAADDSVLEDRPVSWAIDAAGVALIGGTGVVTAQAPGTGTIYAEVEGIAVEIPLTVTPKVARILIDFDEVTLSVGDTLALSATLLDAGEAPIPGVVTWSSDHPDVLAVDEDGVVTALAEGGALITATSGEATVSSTFIVASWEKRALATVDGAPLPAPYLDITQTIDGEVRRTRGTATAGALWLRGVDRRFHFELAGRAQTNAFIPVPVTIAFEGTFTVDAATGEFQFVPDGFEAAFTGRYVGDALHVTWQADPRTAPVALVYTR